MPEITFRIVLELDLYVAGRTVQQYGVYELVGDKWCSTAHVACAGDDDDVEIEVIA